MIQYIGIFSLVYKSLDNFPKFIIFSCAFRWTGIVDFCYQLLLFASNRRKIYYELTQSVKNAFLPALILQYPTRQNFMT